MAHPIALRRLLGSALLALLVAACAGGPSRDDARYDDNRVYRGWVTDAATGKPIEGAVVVAAWRIERLIRFRAAGIADYDVVGLAEVLTDKDGRFEFAPLGSNYGLPLLWRKDETFFPRLAFFKPGYEPTFRDEISWDQERDHLSQLFNNPATASPQKPMGEREVQLFPYLTRPMPDWRAENPIFKLQTAEQKIAASLASFAMAIDSNVQLSDDKARPGSRRHLKAIEVQWRAIVMIEQEMRKYPYSFGWSNAAGNVVRSKLGERGAQ